MNTLQVHGQKNSSQVSDKDLTPSQYITHVVRNPIHVTVLLSIHCII